MKTIKNALLRRQRPGAPMYLALCVMLAAASPATEKSETGTRFVAMDSIALRSGPDGKASKLSELVLGETLELLGERSASEATLRLRCKDVKEHWVRVKTSDGLEGWVFGGALESKKVDPGPQKWRAVISIDSDPKGEKSEDWTFFDQDIAEACKKAKNYFGSATPEDPCVTLGDEKKPITVADLTSTLKTARKTGARWMLIERNGPQKTVTVVPYTLEDKEKAQTFCEGTPEAPALGGHYQSFEVGHYQSFEILVPPDVKGTVESMSDESLPIGQFRGGGLSFDVVAPEYWSEGGNTLADEKRMFENGEKVQFERADEDAEGWTMIWKRLGGDKNSPYWNKYAARIARPKLGLMCESMELDTREQADRVVAVCQTMRAAPAKPPANEPTKPHKRKTR